MRKIIAAINMSVDGVFDHTAMTPGEDVHQHYTELLLNAGTLLYGRITYSLMEDYWPSLVAQPSGQQAMDDFAIAIDAVPKVVFSHTLKELAWKSARLAGRSIEEEIADLKAQEGKYIVAGSRSIIIELMKRKLVDELQLCVHPVIAGTGRRLFEDLQERFALKLLRTKQFSAGALLLYYEPQQF